MWWRRLRNKRRNYWPAGKRVLCWSCVFHPFLIFFLSSSSAVSNFSTIKNPLFSLSFTYCPYLKLIELLLRDMLGKEGEQGYYRVSGVLFFFVFSSFSWFLAFHDHQGYSSPRPHEGFFHLILHQVNMLHKERRNADRDSQTHRNNQHEHLRICIGVNKLALGGGIQASDILEGVVHGQALIIGTCDVCGQSSWEVSIISRD